MKKTLLAQVAILTMLATTGAKAQYGSEYYHRTGDTIFGRPNNGYFVWWGFDDLIRERRGVEFDYTSYTDMLSYEYILMKFYTPTPLRIVGLAGVSVADRGNILLYDATPAGNILKDSVTWNSSDSTFRYLEVKYPKFLAFTDSCCSPTAAILTSTCKLHECYFDSAVAVSDSFYIGGCTTGNDFPLLLSRPHMVKPNVQEPTTIQLETLQQG